MDTRSLHKVDYVRGNVANVKRGFGSVSDMISNGGNKRYINDRKYKVQNKEEMERNKILDKAQRWNRFREKKQVLIDKFI